MVDTPLSSLVKVAPLLDEDDMASDSAAHGATQQSIKAYHDAHGFVDRGDPNNWDFSTTGRTTGNITAQAANKLIDGGADFGVTDIVYVGDWVHNVTDNTWAQVTAIDSVTTLSLDANIFPANDGDAYAIGKLRTDGNWYDMNVAGIVPAGAKGVLFRTYILDDLVSQSMEIQKNGNVNPYATAQMYTQVANTPNIGLSIAACDTNRVVEHKASNTVWTGIFVLVTGWFF